MDSRNVLCERGKRDVNGAAENVIEKSHYGTPITQLCVITTFARYIDANKVRSGRYLLRSSVPGVKYSEGSDEKSVEFVNERDRATVSRRLVVKDREDFFNGS